MPGPDLPRESPPATILARPFRWIRMIRPSRHLIMRAGLVTALLASVGAAAYVAGYKAPQPLLGDASNWLQGGHHVVHVNAETGDADARTARQLATGRQRLEVVQVRPGAVYVVNHDTNEVYRLPTDTMEPEKVTEERGAAGNVTVVAGGERGYLVNASQGTLSRLDGPGAAGRADVPLPAHIDQAVVDSHGMAWAYAPQPGELYTVDNGVVSHRQPVAGPGEHAKLTLAGDKPVVYRPQPGIATVYGPDGPERRMDIPASGQDVVEVSAPGAEPAQVLLVFRGSAEIVLVDFAAGTSRRGQLARRAGHQFGRPVLANGRAYIPDYHDRHLVVVELATLRTLEYAAVPGTSDTFDVSLRDGRVWANDPYADRMLSYDRDGRRKEIGKGEGGGMDDGRGKPADPPPGPSERPQSASPPPPADTKGTPPSNSPKLVTVPDGLVGLDLPEARRRLEAAGLNPAPVARPNGPGRNNEVLSVDPSGGSQVQAGARVTVGYRGPAVVPDLAGMLFDQARRALDGNGTGLVFAGRAEGLAKRVNDVNKVTRQTPPAGAKVPTGTTVTVVYPTQVEVPNVAGTPIAQSCPNTTEPSSGLPCTRHDLGAGNPPNTVLRTSPSPGNGSDPAQAIVMDYYGLGRTAVPNVVGMSPDAACAALRPKLICRQDDNEMTRQPNVVHVQQPAAGTDVPDGTTVVITYESSNPQRLYRYKEPAPGEANVLSFTTGPDRWSGQGYVGYVYPVGAQAPGLTLIYASNCTGCTKTTYYYSGNPAPSNKYSQPQPAFQCFRSQQPGTVPLAAMLKDGDAWKFVPETDANGNPSSDFTVAGAKGWTKRFAVCYVWPGP